jgi:hypothetical protein
MELLADGALAFLAAVGITTLVWLIAGLFTRNRQIPHGTALLLPLYHGSGDLEMAVREVEALRGHLEPQLGILLLDCDLSEEERHAAELLSRGQPKMWLGTAEELEKQLQ